MLMSTTTGPRGRGNSYKNDTDDDNNSNDRNIAATIISNSHISNFPASIQ